MPAIISSDFVLAPTSNPLVKANSPRILYENLVRDATATADEEATDHPVTLLQHWLTAPGERWQGITTNAQFVTFDFGTAKTFDAVGVAAHNMEGATLSVEVSTDGMAWTTASEVIMLANNESILFLFAEEIRRYMRLNIVPASVAPAIGVVYAGSVMSVQHTLYAGHRPITIARNANRIGQIADTGHFLGVVVNSEWYSFEAELTHLKASWVRSEFKMFAQEALTRPFFWAWRPSQYPREVGFAHLTSPALPQNTGPGDLMSVSLSMRGFVS